MWVSRRHLGLVLRKIFGRKSAIDDSDEPMSYRAAALGMIIGGILLLVFCYEAGMSLWVAVLFFVVYFALITSITRMRAEMGVPVHDMHNGGPDQLMATLFGTRFLGARNLSVFSLFWFFNRAHYSDVMPYQLETFKLAERTRSSSRNMLIAMVVSVFLGILATFWSFLHSSHQVGMAGRLEWFGWEPFNRLQRWISNPTRPDYSTGTFLGIGFITTVFFTIMRSRFLWWPLHPAGFTVAFAWSVRTAVMSVFVAWAAKAILLRIGGIDLYRRARPAFLGLIVGYAAGILIAMLVDVTCFPEGGHGLYWGD